LISCSPIGSAAQGRKYFEKGDYYSRNEDVPSQWYGRGAEALCLSGSVDHDQFEQILDGRLPTGNVLGRTNAEGEREHKCGYDLTFSAPKSVSIAALAGRDERLVEAHQQAVRSSLDWLEREAAFTRVKIDGRIQPEHTGSFVVAIFEHETSRALDPQVHSHAIILNATQRSDGAWRSIEGREIMHLQKDVDRVYQNELAVRARSLGYEAEVDREKGRMELSTVPQEVRHAFSSRSSAIESALAENGKTRETASAVEREQACLATRDRKIHADPGELRREWLSRSRELGFDPEKAVADARNRSLELAHNQQPISDRQAEVERALKYAVDHLSERSAAFRATDLDQTLTSRVFGEFSRAEVNQGIDRLKQKGDLIPKEVRSLWDSRRFEPGFTTKDGLKVERQLLSAAKRGHGAFEHGIASGEKACEAIAEAEEKAKWNGEQRQATAGILRSRDRVVAVQGIAGSAKTTTVLKTVGVVAREEGYEVRGLAPSAAAARALEEGTSLKSETTHSFLAELRQAQVQQGREGQTQEQAGRCLWIVDEAGLMSAKQTRDLLRAAEAHDARVLLVGDAKQLGSVEAGRSFAQVQEHVETYRIETVLRQRNGHLRKAVDQAYRGKAAEALGKIQDRGCVIEIGNPEGDREAGLEHRSKAIADAYLALPREERERTIVIASGHDDRAAINGAIRAGLQAEGSVHGEEIQTAIFERRGFTAAEIKAANSYQPQDVVRFSRGYPNHGIDRGSYWQVDLVNSQDRTVILARGDQQIEWRPARLSKVEVYHSQNIELAKGDQIIFTRNDRAAGLINGHTATVVSLDRETGRAEVMGRDGQTREIDLSSQQHWTHSYAVTAHAAQGATADRVLIHAESHRANLTTQKSLYVGISRARDEAQVFTDDAAKLREAVSLRTGEKEVALETGMARADHEYSLNR
jgi:conjugative relaxase-like TrwC/TraI family protein